jgi:hypothetical protein
VGRWGNPPPSILVWDFRLERRASDGAPEPAIAIELRCPALKGLEGSVFNGDELEVDGRHYKPGKTLKVDQVHNLTSNTIVRVRGSSPSRILANPRAERYGVIRGRVTAAQENRDVADARIIVRSFRLQRTGPDGGSLPVVEVEMRSRGFEGSIANGDEVELDASSYKAGHIVGVKQLWNVSSNSVVKARRSIFG